MNLLWRGGLPRGRYLAVGAARQTQDVMGVAVPADLLLCGCVPRVETSIDSDRPLNDATITII